MRRWVHNWPVTPGPRPAVRTSAVPPALWLALTQGDIDAYPEYTGTITRQILRTDPPDLAAALAAYGVRVGQAARVP